MVLTGSRKVDECKPLVSGAPDETNPPWDPNRVAARWCVGQGFTYPTLNP